jgi:hypothetical protein
VAAIVPECVAWKDQMTPRWQKDKHTGWRYLTAAATAAVALAFVDGVGSLVKIAVEGVMMKLTVSRLSECSLRMKCVRNSVKMEPNGSDKVDVLLRHELRGKGPCSGYKANLEFSSQSHRDV